MVFCDLCFFFAWLVLIICACFVGFDGWVLFPLCLLCAACVYLVRFYWCLFWFLVVCGVCLLLFSCLGWGLGCFWGVFGVFLGVFGVVKT